MSQIRYFFLLVLVLLDVRFFFELELRVRRDALGELPNILPFPAAFLEESVCLVDGVAAERFFDLLFVFADVLFFLPDFLFVDLLLSG